MVHFLGALVISVGLLSGCSSSDSKSNSSDNSGSLISQNYQDQKDKNGSVKTVDKPEQSRPLFANGDIEIDKDSKYDYIIPKDALFIDIRNDWERKSIGYAKGSIGGKDTTVYEWREPNESGTGEKNPHERSHNDSFVQGILTEAGGDYSRHIILICHSSSRTAKAKKELKEAGFEKVEHIVGGYEKWKGVGLPVVEPQN